MQGRVAYLLADECPIGIRFYEDSYYFLTVIVLLLNFSFFCFFREATLADLIEGSQAQMVSCIDYELEDMLFFCHFYDEVDEFETTEHTGQMKHRHFLIVGMSQDIDFG